jgi:DNA-binding NarL/FixJ family response regulator
MPNLSKLQFNNIAKDCIRFGSEFRAVHATRVCPDYRRSRVATRPISKRITPREKQVIDLVCKGKLSKEIALQLDRTASTVKAYLHRIFAEVEASNRTELAVWAVTRRENAT